MNKTIIFAVIVIVIVALGGILIANQQKNASESKTMMHTSMQEKPTEVMKKITSPSMKMGATGTPGAMNANGAMMQKENSTGSSMMENK